MTEYGNAMTGRRCIGVLLSVLLAPGALAQDGGISGKDAFEPDNVPEDATWRGLVELGNESTVRRHNFHEKFDEDWFFFYAQAGQFLIIRTFQTFPRADTYLALYRPKRVGEGSGPVPNSCTEETDVVYTSPDGQELLLLACNDDVDGSVPQIRSRINYTTAEAGLYYVRVRLSPSLTGKDAKGTEEETTYSVQAVFDPNQGVGLLPNALFATLLDEGDKPIETGEVYLTPIGITVDENVDGVYPVAGLPDSNYTVTASAAGFETSQRVVSLSGGETRFDDFKLSAVAVPHSADYINGNGVLELAEVLRVIQFYNAGGLQCSGGTEDGYAPGTGNEGCAPHASDYDPNDWTIDLGELLRLIQLFNMKSIVSCESSEDGYCPQ